MPTWKLIVEYNGTRYAGWQSQGAGSKVKTVQGELKAAAEAVFGRPVELGGAGRTDAGVHAIGQVAHLKVASSARPPRPRDLMFGLNDGLPADLSVRAVERAEDRFHSRHDAVERIYTYQIATRPVAFGKPYCWWVKDDLDLDRMARATGKLVGMHDFRAFASKPEPGESTLVDLTQLSVGQTGDLIVVRVGASHFLMRMVRRLVGALVEVGRGNVPPEALFDRFVARPPKVPTEEPGIWTAPPAGLFLDLVRYPGDPAAPTAPVPAILFR